MAAHDDDVLRFYRRYLTVCNRHAWNELAPFLADTVLVNEVPRTRREYIADLTALESSFPDYRWELRRAIVQGDWLAVHLHDTGTRVEPFLDSPGDSTRRCRRTSSRCTASAAASSTRSRSPPTTNHSPTDRPIHPR